MTMNVKEMRLATGLSQTAFSRAYRIPVSTLRKWEQGDASPAPYVLDLLAAAIPVFHSEYEKVSAPDGTVYYHDPVRNIFMDALGNTVSAHESAEGVSRKNLGLYLKELFEGYYQLQDKLDRDLAFDKKEGIEWI